MAEERTRPSQGVTRSHYVRPPKARRSSSSFVLGALSGLLATVTSIPVLMPLSSRLRDAELHADIEIARREALEAASQDRETGAEDLTSYPCDNQARLVREPTLAIWACATSKDGRRFPVVRPLPSDPESLGSLFVLSLAAIVGLSTALGTLQFLSPLNRLPGALAQLARGKAISPISHTGLREIDDLIDRINATSQASLEREEAIRGRVTIVQELARIVAHELRNPLQAMEFMAELLKGEEDADERRVVASDLQREIRSLDGVVSQMLHAPEATALRLQRRPCPAQEPVQRVLMLRRPDANAADVRLEDRVEYRGTVSMDITLVTRALENLVANAIAFSPSGRGQVHIHVKREDGSVEFVVDDNGPGVPEDMRKQVFESNYTTRKGGHGLGLVLVAAVAHAHGGHARVTSSPLGGARFILSLPIEAADPQEMES